jgi:hypothetical protein
LELKGEQRADMQPLWNKEKFANFDDYLNDGLEESMAAACQVGGAGPVAPNLLHPGEQQGGPVSPTPKVDSLQGADAEKCEHDPLPRPAPQEPGKKTDLPKVAQFTSPLAESPQLKTGKSTHDPPEVRIKKLYHLIGPAVVVPLPYGEKGPCAKGWQDVTYEQSLEPDYQGKIYACFWPKGGNLGVIVGPPSADLVDVDIDADEYVEPFLEVNPRLRETLRRRGKRGCGLMLRMEGEYPIGRWYLKLTNGTTFGEWRAGGGHQSVIFGRHPETTEDGQPIDYRILVANRPIRMRFTEIIWPDWVARPLPWEKPSTPGPSTSSEKNTDANLDKRVRAYMATLPIAISGQRGHDTTFKVAIALIQGWGLSLDEARPYLEVYNALCQPPWSAKELEHKLADAVKAPLERPYGFLRNSELPKMRTSRLHLSEYPLEGNEEHEGNSPPKPKVEWANPVNPSNPSGGNIQKAPYPPRSIFEDFYDYAVTQTEGADCYIIGPILAVGAALLRRNVWTPWPNGVLYPNLFDLVVGPQGNMKSTSIELAELIAKGVFAYLGDVPYFLPHSYSPESLFDAYFKHPHRLFISDDANAALNRWGDPHVGDRLSSDFLRLFDCKALSETFRRNRSKEGELESQERWTELTSTSIVFGVTYNACEFRGNTQRSGLQRRFLPYVAEDTVRVLDRPVPSEETVNGLVKQFSLLTYLRGVFSWTKESEKLFDDYKAKIDARIRACDILDDRTRGRLRTACAWVAKIAMIFEAGVLCYDAKWMPADPEIVPDKSPPLVFHHDTLQLAIDHVEECLKAASLLDSVVNRKSIAEQAEVLLTYLRTRFGKLAHEGSIVLTRTQITDTYAHNASRRSDSPISDIYDRFIPYLIRIGEAQLLTKEGKKEIYAFRADEPAKSA